jgi:hypothetical protein
MHCFENSNTKHIHGLGGCKRTLKIYKKLNTTLNSSSPSRPPPNPTSPTHKVYKFNYRWFLLVEKENIHKPPYRLNLICEQGVTYCTIAISCCRYDRDAGRLGPGYASISENKPHAQHGRLACQTQVTCTSAQEPLQGGPRLQTTHRPSPRVRKCSVRLLCHDIGNKTTSLGDASTLCRERGLLVHQHVARTRAIW